MTQPSTKCPKCSGEMSQGFVLDHGHYNARIVSHWIPGPPQKSFWKGIRIDDEQIPIATFRCGSCGFLESYAQPNFAAQ